jgi:hypothetical protein
MKTKTRVPESRKSARSTTRAASKTKAVRKLRSHKGETPYDRVKHLSGILNGPGDLSTNPKYIEGYGRDENKVKLKAQKLLKIEKPDTPYERTKHLLEVLTDLPADLLTNPKYFEDFGR